MAKPHDLLMVFMSLVVFGFAIAGTADYWLKQEQTGGGNAKVGLWRVKVEDAQGNTQLKSNTDDKNYVVACVRFRNHIKAASAFAILTCIFSLVALAGFAINCTGNDAPLGLLGAVLTIVFDVITWAIMTGARNQPHCKGATEQIHLDDTTPGNVQFKFYNGWYFFLVPWCIYVVCLILYFAMKSSEDSAEANSAEEKSSEPTAEKSRGAASEGAVKEKTDDNAAATSSENEPTSENKSRGGAAASGEVKEKKADPPADDRSEAQKKKDQKEKEEKEAAAAAAEKKRLEEEKKQAEEEEKQAAAEAAEMAKELNAKDVERRRKIWGDLKHRLPADKKDKEQRRQRFELWDEFRGEKKYLTAADMDHGCQTTLGLGQLKKGLGHILPKAHIDAKAVHAAAGRKKKEKPEFIERNEFRLMFVFITRMFDQWFLFDTLDVDNKGSITAAEFEKGVPEMKKQGREVKDAKAEFKSANASKNGKLTFAEFCDWQAKNATFEDDGDHTDVDDKSEEESAAEKKAHHRADVERRKKIWAELSPNLPTNKKSKEERARRFQYFRDFDVKGRGFLTLEDVEEGCATVLGLGQLGRGLKNLLPLAHNSARGVHNVKGQATDADEHVEKSEMRLLFVYIHQYFDLWFIFDLLDEDRGGEIDFDEFSRGIPEVEKWAGIKITDVKAEFRAADPDNGGSICFTEFCEWAHSKNDKDE